MMRKYEIRQSDAEGAPIINRGECNFFINDRNLVPAGYGLDVVENSPTLKTVFVTKE